MMSRDPAAAAGSGGGGDSSWQVLHDYLYRKLSTHAGLQALRSSRARPRATSKFPQLKGYQ
jgi:hypothetical protein